MAGIIYGQECVTFNLTFTDTFNAAQENTLDWIVEDTLLDNTDNSTIVIDNPLADTVSHSYQSSGVKAVDIELDFDDGWGNIYQHQYGETVEPIPYPAPEFAWTYNPDPFRINEEFIVTNVYNDLRPFGEIKDVSFIMDLDNNPTVYEVQDYPKDDTFTYAYDVKDTYNIAADVEYWDGWEYQIQRYIDEQKVANSPPSANYTLSESGICVTRLDLTDVATDPDGVSDIIYRHFELQQQTDATNDIWAMIHNEDITSTGGVYSYQFAVEGTYKVIYTVTDSENATDIKETVYDIVFRECGDSVNTGSMSGRIKLQKGWQLIAVPALKGYWDTSTSKIAKDTTVDANIKNFVLDQISDKMGIPYENLNEHIEVSIAYRGGELSQNFVTGFTLPSSVNNFKLAYNDVINNKLEFTAFWIKVTSDLDIPEIEWEYISG